MKLPVYEDSTPPPPTYVPASDPVLSSYQEPTSGSGVLTGQLGIMTVSPPMFGGAGAPGVYSTDAGTVASSPVASSPVASSPVASSPVASSPVASSPVASPRITVSTDSARQVRRISMATGSPVQGTVTQASPLRIVVDGATVDSLANVLDGATYLLNARVSVLLRNPQMPLVQGVLS